MAKNLTTETARSIFRAVPSLIELPAARYWVDYDQEADVLYVSFERPQRVTDTVATDDGLLLRYRGDRLVGVTVLEASTRARPEPDAA